MRQGFLLVALFGLTSLLAAAPRFFAPVYLKIGAVNELYVWDEKPVQGFRVEVRRPGSQTLLWLARGFAVDRPLSVLGESNRPLHWAAALIAPDALEAPGLVHLKFLDAQGTVLGEATSEIRPRVFPGEEIRLDQTMSALRSQPDKRKDREAAEIWKVYERFDARFSWPGGRFLLPVASTWPTSAQFGDVRHYVYSDAKTAIDYHHGTDFAVPVGTLVSCAAPGTVAMTADRMLTGKTIVVEHAPGVYSVYFHLSQIQVAPGQKVRAGSPLGLSGATGLVTGPHLHWEVRVGGVPVDALDLVTDGLLDTQGVNAIVSSVNRSIH